MRVALVVNALALLVVSATVTVQSINLGSNPRAVVPQRKVPDWTVQLLDGSADTPVHDAKCNLASVRRANSQQIHGILSDLLNTTYFRMFRVNKDGECPLDKKKSITVTSDEQEDMRESTCEDDDTQESNPFLSGFDEMSTRSGLKKKPKLCDIITQKSNIDKTKTSIEDKLVDSHKNDSDCDDENSPNFWLNICSKLPTSSSEYVNLQLNTEHYTGYNGSKIWEAIYVENCFKGERAEDMCYEERVLYRLLSGLHASINTHVCMNFYPPKKYGNEVWLPNPDKFMHLIGNHPDRINNLHFAFVVLLRALRKSTPQLRTRSFDSGNEEEDIRTSMLVNHLLDSYVLSSCSDVFEAFDESLLFQAGDGIPSAHSSLKRDFKRVFHNISDIFNCVKCQRCRLHGKMQLLGVGTALKVLLLPEDLVSLSRDEVVAFINTIGKFSEALNAIPTLIEQFYWDLQNKNTQATDSSELKEVSMQKYEKSSLPIKSQNEDIQPSRVTLDIKSRALAAVSEASRKRIINQPLEDELVDAALDGHEELALLAQHFSHDAETFVRHATRRLRNLHPREQHEAEYDAIIIGGGLAGTTVALTLLDRGARVAIVEKEGFLGGNSARASSGINGIDANSPQRNDSIGLYEQDILRGGKREGKHSLVAALANGSIDALNWLRNRVHIPLEEIAQLGGHSIARTYRPKTGLAGAEFITAIKKQMEAFEPVGLLRIFTKTAAEGLLDDRSQVAGVACRDVITNRKFNLSAPNVVLATGGFAYDRSKNGLLQKYRPDLVGFGTTNGKFATGDGLILAHNSTFHASLVDMEHVQVHPTGFVDINDVAAREKKLCAEVLRGAGGILLDENGKRFANELGTRDYLTKEMLKRHDKPQPEFTIFLNQLAASKATVHVAMYEKRGLLFRFDNLENAASWMNISKDHLLDTLVAYDKEASEGKDSFGKSVFPSTPILNGEPYYLGKVTPVLHYSMGGLAINPHGMVLNEIDGKPIPGLYAAGEVVGGIHGENRLGGNALTECVVFGRIVGNAIKLKSPILHGKTTSMTTIENKREEIVKEFSSGEILLHNQRNDCWVVLYNDVYDLTNFVDEHPAGPESITQLCGKDGTKEYEEIHSRELLKDFKRLGVLASEVGT